MANYNQFKKHAMIFAKNKKQRIIIERIEDRYYISEGFTMLRTPSVFYDVLIRPLSPLFLPLENGQKATRRPGEILAEIEPGTTREFADIFTRYSCETPATVTPFMYAPVQDQKINIRLVDVGGKLVQYNDGYISAIMEYADSFKASAERFPVLKWEDEAGTGCLILPVNNKPCFAAMDDLREVLRK